MGCVRTTWIRLLAAGALMAQDDHIAARQQSWKGLEIWFVTRIEPPGTKVPGAGTRSAHHSGSGAQKSLRVPGGARSGGGRQDCDGSD